MWGCNDIILMASIKESLYATYVPFIYFFIWKSLLNLAISSELLDDALSELNTGNKGSVCGVLDLRNIDNTPFIYI